MNISLQVGADIIRSYRRLAYTPWHALAEFVDNSTQSLADNKAALTPVLESDSEKLTVSIVYNRDNETLRIADNAMGMDFPELENALKIGTPPPNTKGRSQYGLGMKTAACWFGEEWSITTKKLGSLTEHTVTVNVDAVASGQHTLPHTTVQKENPNLHYTYIEVRKLYSKIQGRTITKIRDYLASMFRADLRAGTLELQWEGTSLVWDENLTFLAAANGALYKKPVDFKLDNGKAVTGWVGILGEGTRSRYKAGFAILRRGRVLRAHPDEWRPEIIFGAGGRNDLINQRLAGELHFDDFEVSHTKDAILWVGDEQDEVEKRLKEASVDYVAVARIPLKDLTDRRGPSETEVQAAVDELKTEMQSPQFADRIQITDVPPPAVAEAAAQPLLDSARRTEPRFFVRVGITSFKVYLSTDASPNDPYFATETPADELLVVVNCNHPHWSSLSASEGVANYLRHCVYDAIAEWQCRRKTADLQPSTIKLLKDALLRLPAEIEDAGVAS
jgi:hypothetical protein